jgi:Glycosyltransferase family 87
MRRIGAAAVLVALVAGTWGVLHVGWYTHHQITDLPVYEKYGSDMAHGHRVPYRDFELEYPPAALVVFAVPSFVDQQRYSEVFKSLMFICDAVLVLAVAAVAGYVPGVLAAVAPLALGPVVATRFDLWPAALAAVAVSLLVRRRHLSCGIVLGTAFAAKLWPAVLGPIFLVWLVRTEGTRVAARWLAAAVATAAAWFLPFVALSPGGVAHSFHAQLARPLQLESLGGAILLTVHHLTRTSLGLVEGFGSQNLAGSGVHAAQVATTIVGVVAVLAVWLLFARGPVTTERLLVSSAAGVAALVAFGKVFSPQFMIWLIPVVALVRGARRPAAWFLLYAGLVLTQSWFPRRYWDLAQQFASTQVIELLARDLCVVALFVVLAWPALQDEVFGEHRSRIEALQRVRAQID